MTIKTTLIRVTRQRTFRVEDYVDIPIVQEDDITADDPADLAADLVKALTGAGHDVDWVETSEKEESYPRAQMSGAVAPPMNVSGQGE